MSEVAKAIVLSSIKYGDTSLIVKAFTEARGLQTYMVRGILKKRKGGFKAGHFLPLTQLELSATPSKGGKLGYVRTASIACPYTSVHSDVRKSSVALFLSEMLTQCIREESPNPDLFHYLESAFQWLDQQEHSANFHLRFLMGLTRFLGFYPDTTDRTAPYFDLQEGAFVREPQLNPVISGELLDDFNNILGTKFEALERVKMTQKRRRELIRTLVLYFQIHLHGFKEPRSLGVLDEVFS